MLTRFGLAVASLVPPAVLGARFWPSVSAHPVVSPLLFLGYGALPAGLGFLGKVYGKVADRWVERVADAVDRRLRWRLSRFERDYRAYVLGHHRFIRGHTAAGGPVPVDAHALARHLDTSTPNRAHWSRVDQWVAAR
ncbi:hypothetical protein [Streptomyces violaceusniger]|uniref:hypothetical protein n=1 Tax=Streptomyces violaceusniger TaxID=68280 RepID=UPI0001E4C623|nr:hypothetical protein [Streptomyces violaceusniger]